MGTVTAMRVWTFLQTLWKKRFPRRVPYLQQLTTVECGAACLAMVLTYHGRETTVAETRDACVVGRDGLRASTIARTARHFGLAVRAFSSDLASLKHVSLPAIIHWELSHFVVLEQWGERGATIVDPAVGRQHIALRDFQERFSGVVLTFQPTPALYAGKAQLKRPQWIRQMVALSLETKHAKAITILAATARILSLFLPLFLWILLDGAVRYRSLSVLWAGGGVALLLLICRFLVLATLSGLVRSGNMAGQVTGQTHFINHLFGLPIQFFQQRSSGDLLMRAQSAVQLANYTGGQLIADLADLACCVFLIALLAYWLPWFALAVLVLSLLGVLGACLDVGHRERLAQENMRRTSQQQGYLLEVLRGAISLKASGSEQNAIQRWRMLLSAQLNVHTRLASLAARARMWEAVIAQGGPLAFLVLAVLAALSGKLTIGVAAAAVTASLGLLGRVRELTDIIARMRDSKSHWERVQDVLESQLEQDEHASVRSAQLLGQIEVKNISFQFTLDSPLVVQGVSCVVQAGQKVAIVGASGSGKSTLAMLMLGLYRPTEGDILFDGQPVSGMDLTSLRRQVGVVLQDQFLFGGSIRQNISFGTSGLTLEQVAQAAHFAGIHQEIVKMPMGYETVLYESGANLSGGQRQRLLIARAIASRPRLLLMDEATSHLDTVSEAHVDASLSQLSCTRLVIAHRLSTVKNADRILVMQNGVLVQTGTHGELIEQDGEYRRLCSTSAGSLQ